MKIEKALELFYFRKIFKLFELEQTAITDHVLAEQHQFDLSQAKIVDRSQNYQSLKTLEMLYISSNQESCNYRSDVSNTIQ
jgi:hypothetical protein